MLMKPEDDDVMVKILLKNLKDNKNVPFALAFDFILSKYENGADANAESSGIHKATKLTPQDKELAKKVLRPLFKKYDFDNSNSVEAGELKSFMKNEFGKDLNEKEIKLITDAWDTDGTALVSFDNFVEGLFVYYIEHKGECVMTLADAGRTQSILGEYQRESGGGVNDLSHSLSQSMERSTPKGGLNKLEPSYSSFEVDEEEEEGSDDESDDDDFEKSLEDLSPEEKKKAILKRACLMMFTGTVIVLLMSDPMVAVLSEMGARTGIPAFFVSFVLAPLASNSSELIASYNYAAKKTKASIQVSLSQLLGAANLNNTFCLGIFLALICFRPLVWEFTAETLSILVIEIVMFLYTLKTTQTLLDGCIICSLFFLSILLVYILEYPLQIN